MKSKMNRFRCDVCGRFISIEDLNVGNAVRRMVTPDSAFSAEDYEAFCTICRQKGTRFENEIKITE